MNVLKKPAQAYGLVPKTGPANRFQGLRTLACAGLFLLAGCAAAPAPDSPLPALPGQWMRVTAEGVAAGAPTSDAQENLNWWRSFGSAELDDLLAQALEYSYDVAAAAARVRQAQASARIAGAALLPDLDASVETGRQGRLGGHAFVEGNTYAAGLNTRYEVDFWGGNRAARDSALGALAATRFDRDTIRLTLLAGTASTWVQAVALSERAAIAERNLRSAQGILAVVRAQYAAGAATELDVARQGALVSSQRRALEALRQQAGQARIALALLTGQAADLPIRTETLTAIRQPVVHIGLPSDLLLRRPDIAGAEARLAAADADVHAARAAMLPSLVLSAHVGAGGTSPARIFDNPLYSLAAGLTAPIFNAGRLAAGHDLALAQREELLAGYRQTIVAAFADVQTALAAMQGVQAQREAQAEELAQAQLALRLAESRHREGAETMLTLLDAQRTLYAAQDMAAYFQALHLQAAIDLYRALGGGWARRSMSINNDNKSHYVLY
ncbi:efflux transporter outer membrane subunit [Pusillimonas caeni]|nr:efflux transporter outer membrane subunit [Pusillimonas caeni]TFL11533.1 efflux transporter outer membrane subunit [Pusillimonas caeni]